MNVASAVCMASSKKRAAIVSRIAACVYFTLIVFQFPLFRVPCTTGICSTPIEVTSFQLIASQVLPAVVVKALLYPGAIAGAIVKNKAIPSFGNLLNDVYHFGKVKQFPVATDLHHLEVIVGSYFSVAGAFLGILKPGRMSLFGTLLIMWDLAKSNRDHTMSVKIYPTMSIALISAFFSARRDVRRIIRSCRAKHLAQQLCIYSKSKYKAVKRK